MDIKQVIEENLSAVKAFKDKITGLDNEILSVKDRLKGIEQTVAHSPRLQVGFGATSASRLASQLQASDGFKAFVSGNAKVAKIALQGPLMPKNTIVGDVGSPPQPGDVLSQADRMPGIVAGPFRQPRIRDLLPVLPTSSNMVEYTRELAWTNNAAPQQGEGAVKAESSLTFELKEAPVRTIAHFIKASKQVIADQPALEQLIDRRMLHGLQMAEEDQILNGDGTGYDLDGLIQNATPYNKAETGDQYLDTLNKAIEQVSEADWTATGIILNTQDWGVISRMKDGEDRYLFGAPNRQQPRIIWGLPVVVTNSMNPGEFIVADFDNAAVLWDRQNGVVEMFEEDADNVQRNLVTIRAEMRVTLTVLRPAAIVHGAFA